MDLGIRGKTALVTGASRNVGRAVAVALAKEGVNLFLCSKQDTKGLSTTAKAATDLGVEVHHTTIDITNPEAVRRIVADQPIDILVNNAVVRSEARIETPSEEWSAAIAVNIYGAVNVTQAVFPSMRAKGWGRIINFSGIGSYLGHGVIRSTTKQGIVGFSRALASELGPYGITINCVAPGVLDTSRYQPLSEQCLRDEGRRSVPRRGKVDEIAALVTFLASDLSGYINGQCIHIDGGAYYA